MPRAYERLDVAFVAIVVGLSCLIVGGAVAHEMTVRHYEYAYLLTPWVV